MKKRILIEPLLFGDYYVAVYGKRDELLLDKKYFTSSLLSAKITALDLSLRNEWKGLKVYLYDNQEQKEVLLKDQWNL